MAFDLRTMAAAVLGLMALWPAGAQAKCQLAQVAQMKLDVQRLRPLIQGEIDGRPVRLLLDTGTTYSAILRAYSTDQKMHEMQLPGTRFYGAGGETLATYVDLTQLKIGSLEEHETRMLVLGARPTLGPDGAVALIGTDFWEQGDDEIDLAHGVANLIKPIGCSGDEVLYWPDPFSATKLLITSSRRTEYMVSVTIDGVPLRAELDTGSQRSYVTRQGYARMGRPWPSMESVTNRVNGLGKIAVPSTVVTFEEFGFDEEKIKHPKIAIADIFGEDKDVPLGSRARQDLGDFPEMILGADFFMAHRVLISNSQRKVYITYNGGKLF
jgi:predicted aspartyl protease